jgi:hypothetical protein
VTVYIELCYEASRLYKSRNYVTLNINYYKKVSILKFLDLPFAQESCLDVYRESAESLEGP